MYKALVTDIDGTAVPISSDGSDISESTKLAVSTAISLGKVITCATGRQWALAKPVITQLGIVSPCIVEGGTRIIDPTSEETIWEKALDEHEPRRLLEILKSETTDGLLMHSDNLGHRPIKSVNELPGHLRFVYLISITSEVADKITERVANETHAVAHYTPSWYGNGLVDVHITHPEATKQHAIEVWQGLQGITKDETIGMGDSGNDLPIFHAAGYKIAVGNATNNLKSVADLITAPVTENALEKVISTILTST